MGVVVIVKFTPNLVKFLFWKIVFQNRCNTELKQAERKKAIKTDLEVVVGLNLMSHNRTSRNCRSVYPCVSKARDTDRKSNCAIKINSTAYCHSHTEFSQPFKIYISINLTSVQPPHSICSSSPVTCLKTLKSFLLLATECSFQYVSPCL